MKEYIGLCDVNPLLASAECAGGDSARNEDGRKNRKCVKNFDRHSEKKKG